ERHAELARDTHHRHDEMEVALLAVPVVMNGAGTRQGAVRRAATELASFQQPLAKLFFTAFGQATERNSFHRPVLPSLTLSEVLQPFEHGTIVIVRRVQHVADLEIAAVRLPLEEPLE